MFELVRCYIVPDLSGKQLRTRKIRLLVVWRHFDHYGFEQVSLEILYKYIYVTNDANIYVWFHKTKLSIVVVFASDLIDHCDHSN